MKSALHPVMTSESRIAAASDGLLSLGAVAHGPDSARSAAERRGWAVALAAAAALHLMIPLAFILYGSLGPQPAPPVEEIPVEVVVEQPKPPEPEPKKEDAPKPPPQPEDERPAYDAPGAATEEKANRESRADKSQAPKRDVEPQPEPGAPPQSDQPPAAAQEMAVLPPTPPPRPADEADQAAAAPPTPDKAPQPAPKPAPAAPAPPGAPLPQAETLPDYEIARATTPSPVVGGNADSRYMTIVYGMIMKHYREPQSGPRPRPSGGAIVFLLDEAGNLVDRRVLTQSGSPNLDMAMMNAIAAAAPYPAPPGWQPRSMRLVYGNRR